MSKTHEEREVQQKVNNADGTQTVITVKERRLKKAHDKMMSKLQSRQRRAAAEVEAQTSASVESEEVPAGESQTPAETPKSGRRKKAEPTVPTPEPETTATEEESPTEG